MEKLRSVILEKSRSIVRSQFEKLKKEAISFGVPQDNFQLIKDLNEVLNLPPFNQINPQNSNSQNRPVVFCDFDGVISDPWDNNHSSNLERLLALRRIIGHSAEFHLWSMRIPVDDDGFIWRHFLARFFDRTSITSFPFFTDTSLRRLYNFFQKAPQKAPQSPLIELHPRKNKFALSKNDDPFLEKAIKVLERGDDLIIIGSSVFDRRNIKQLFELAAERNINLARLYYFDTGHLVL